MCQLVIQNRPVTFLLINRTNTINIANLIDEGEART
jgi:hypothetical protein